MVIDGHAIFNRYSAIHNLETQGLETQNRKIDAMFSGTPAHRVINPKRACKMSILRVHSIILSTLESFPQHPPPLDSEGWTHARSVTLHPVLQLQNQPGGISNLALDFSIDALSMGSNGSQFALVGFHHPSRCCAAGGDFEPSDQAPGALFCVHLLYRCLR